MKVKSLQRGQSLIEVLIALAAAAAVVAAIAVTVVISLSNVTYTKNQNLATQYSREGMEIVRQLAKNNWTNFKSYNSDYCLENASLTLVPMGAGGCGQNVGGPPGSNLRIFVRQITIEQDSPSCPNNPSNNVKITSTVSWSDSKCQAGNIFCHNVSLESCLADINTVKAP